MALEPGSFLHNRYRIEGQLGKGGMGAVYLAYDETLQIKVALKENLNLNPESERQFHREATLLASLRHPNLPRVTDHFILEGRQYLVMDYIEGEDLHGISRKKRPSVSDVLDWADGICDALSYLHSRKPPIIHRDIKPANLKLQPDGNVVLVDFGIAKIFDQAQTTTGARGLTPGYSPPEQYGGSRTDERSDQYALAATIYSLLTGKAPADSIERMLKKEILTPASTINSDIPTPVDEALTTGLALDQDDRFPSVADFKSALHQPVSAATMPAPTPAVESAATVRVDLPAGTGASTVQTDQVAANLSSGTVVVDSIPQEAPRRGSPLVFLIPIVIVLLLILGGGGAYALFGGGLGSGADSEPTDPIAVAIANPTETVQPTDTPPAEPIATIEPSATAELPTDTPAPTEQVVMLGGGGLIAFSSDRGEGANMQIWVMDPDGENPRQLTFGPGDKAQPKWSPDGSRLLFAAPGGTDDFNNDLGTDIFVINPDGTGLKNVTHSVGDESYPEWSPDGTQISFASTRVNDVNQVFILDAACMSQAEEDSCWDLDPRRISCTSEDFCAVEYSPAWSPDGSTIAVAASINNALGRIYLRTPFGGEPTRFDRSDTIIGADHLAWSPDGTALAYTWIQPTFNEIYVVPADSPRSWVKLTNTLGNREPTYSPDGQFIAFTSTRDQNLEIYRMAADGSDPTNLSQSPTSKDIQADWQPLPES
jgi:predicted Ser/Thr protein kinase